MNSQSMLVIRVGGRDCWSTLRTQGFSSLPQISRIFASITASATGSSASDLVIFSCFTIPLPASLAVLRYSLGGGGPV